MRMPLHLTHSTNYAPSSPGSIFPSFPVSPLSVVLGRASTLQEPESHVENPNLGRMTSCRRSQRPMMPRGRNQSMFVSPLCFIHLPVQVQTRVCVGRASVHPGLSKRPCPTDLCMEAPLQRLQQLRGAVRSRVRLSCREPQSSVSGGTERPRQSGQGKYQNQLAGSDWAIAP